MLLDYLYPPACIFCGRLLPIESCCESTGERKLQYQKICNVCERKIKVISGSICMRCGKPIESTEQEYCFDCTEGNFAFHRNRSVFEYDGAIRKAMHDFKYAHRRENGIFFAEEMVTHLGEWMTRLKVDAVIPVPLHKRRKRRRGYNQAAVLAQGIAQYLGVPMDEGILLRLQATKPQKELGRAERKINLKNAFKIAENEVQYERVLLIDDIYTTGATLDAAARVLKQVGVRDVYCVTACIGKGY